jgi:putative DNA primase/helicase
MRNPAQEFRAEIQRAGLTPPDEVIADGKLHRFPTNGRRGDDSGWYVLHADGIPAGAFGDWRSGISSTWRADVDRPLTPDEEAAARRRFDELRKKDETQRQARAERAAALAAEIWKAARPAGEDHCYLKRKGVRPVDTLREMHADELAERLGYAPQARGEVLQGRVLIVPVRVGGKLATLELIDEQGRKSALAGGIKRGGYWATGPLPDAGRIVVAEGAATALSIAEALGEPVAAALSVGNLPAAGEAIRQARPRAELVIAADLADDSKPHHDAVKASEALRCSLVAPDFGGERPEGASDFNDLATLRGLEAVRACIKAAEAPVNGEHQPGAESAAVGDPGGSDDEEIIRRLAELPLIEYDRSRKSIAKRLGVRPSTLDAMVAAERDGKYDDGMGLPDVEPWPSPVEPAALLSDVAKTVRRFIVCQQEVADAVSLWVAMTWFMDAVQIAPLAVITAPEKRCGKSQLLALIGKLSYRPLSASNISPAAMFRAVDVWQPTLLIDETDSFLKDNEELRGIINAGHTRDSAYVVRVVGEELKPARFAIWGAKALAGIGHLADTIMDRAILLELRRKLPHEKVERLRHAEPGLFDELSAKLARFANDYREQVRRARPELPDSLHDRAQDNWEPLLAIADVAGGDWPARGRRAALKLSGTDSPTMSTGTELLADIRDVFDSLGVDRIATRRLIEELCADDERPWATYNHGKPITPRQVAKRLGEYGITSTTIRIGLETPKGYRRDMFEEAFQRYSWLPMSLSQSYEPVGHRWCERRSGAQA